MRRNAKAGRIWWSIVSLTVVLAACGGEDATTPAPSAAIGSPASTTPSPDPITSHCSDETKGADFRTITFPAPDGVMLYGAVAGSGRVGVVLANDVPHPICEEIAPAVALVKEGFRAILFDYRDQGGSETSEEGGRLDLDVAGAAAELRRRGSDIVVLLGSYAGVAASLVAASRITLPVAAIVGFSPTAIRGQYVEGPFDPQGPLEAARRVHVPALYVTRAYDSFVPLRDARSVYEATASRDKRLIVVRNGIAGWYLLDGETRNEVMSFIQEHT